MEIKYSCGNCAYSKPLMDHDHTLSELHVVCWSYPTHLMVPMLHYCGEWTNENGKSKMNLEAMVKDQKSLDNLKE